MNCTVIRLEYAYKAAFEYGIVAELLRSLGARAEPPTNNLLTYRSKTFWLSRDCQHVCPYANTLKNKSSTICIATP